MKNKIIQAFAFQEAGYLEAYSSLLGGGAKHFSNIHQIWRFST